VALHAIEGDGKKLRLLKFPRSARSAFW